jgi:hypothetical protein
MRLILAFFLRPDWGVR